MSCKKENQKIISDADQENEKSKATEIDREEKEEPSGATATTPTKETFCLLVILCWQLYQERVYVRNIIIQ